MHRGLFLLCKPAAWSVALLIFNPVLTGGQTWQWVVAPGGQADESGEGVAVDMAGRIYLWGTFENFYDPAGDPLQAFGGKDLYLTACDAAGNPQWAVSAGSALDDRADAVAVDNAGNILCTGSYWQQGHFGDQEIMAAPNIKGIFLAKYETGGRLLWVQPINGTALKEARALAVDEAGNCYLAGFFSGELLIENATVSARGITDLFLLKFDPAGHLLWAVHDGTTGDTRAMALAVTPEEEIVVGGYFNDTLRIAGETLTANTFDRDVFLARYDRNGRPMWARKAGGVHDDDLTALAIDSRGDIHVTGFLVGVMQLSDTLVIQSRTGNSDFYLLRYRADGLPLAARAMGGLQIQQATSLVLLNDEPVIGGYYQGEMTIDGVSVNAGGGFGSFITAFDGNQRLVWLKNISSSAAGGVYLTSMASTPAGDLLSAGSFEDDAAFDDFTRKAVAGFDPFLARLATSATGASGPAPQTASWRFFPNPATDVISLETNSSYYTIRLFSAAGLLLQTLHNPVSVDLQAFPSGLYILIFQDSKALSCKRLVVAR